MINLNIPRLININEGDTLKVDINLGKYKFAPNAMVTGNSTKFPIFGSNTYLNGESVYMTEYGLPFIKFWRNETQHYEFTNNTPYFFNMHFHGLNTNPFLDGTSYTAEYGKDTKIGKTLKYSWKIHNNSMLGWFHPHVEFISSQLVYSGLVGIYEVGDDFSKKLDEIFEYGDNYVILVYSDADLNIDGSLNNRRLNTQNWRGYYGLINGQICLNWTLGNLMPFYTNQLFHTVNKNLVKLSFLNGSSSFRTVYLGVCDKRNIPLNFYFMQTDGGLRVPVQMKMLSISPAERVSIVIDINDFFDQEAIIFFYNFDLTYIYSNLSDVYLSNNKNIVTMFNQSYNCGIHQAPGIQYLPAILGPKNHIKQFLTIKMNKIQEANKINKINHYSNNKLCLNSCIQTIKQIVLGEHINNELLKQNYTHLLNPFYYYNLPSFDKSTPTRQIIFNMLSYPDPNITEWVNMQPRAYADMWNSYEYKKWKETGSHHFLPTCLIQIQDKEEYVNYKSLQNNILTITISDDWNILESLQIKIPATKATPLNIEQWIHLINSLYQNTPINISNNKYKLLSDILSIEWTDYLFKNEYLWNSQESYKPPIFIKTVLIKNINKSEYKIQLSGSWKLLMFFGKAIGSTVPGKNMRMLTDIPTKSNNVISNSINNVESFFGMYWYMLVYMIIGMILGMYISKYLAMQFNIMSMTLNNVGMYVGMIIFMASDMGLVKSMMIFLTIISLKFYLILFMYYAKNMRGIKILSITALLTIIVYCIFYYFPTKKRSNKQMQVVLPTEGTKNGLNLLNGGWSNIFNLNYQPTITISPYSNYQGIMDGYMNDLFMNFAVRKNSSEQWIFTNLDQNNVHPLHFHLTSGYMDLSAITVSNCLKKHQFENLTYSKDVYSIGIQQTFPFNLKFPNYSSQNGVVKNLGLFYHCHFMLHHDMMMMGQYYIYENKHDYFY